MNASGALRAIPGSLMPVLVAVRHRGYWFYISADDAESKRAFQLLQVLIGMRLAEGTLQSVPTLTIPVAK